MKSLREKLMDADRRAGHYRLEILVPVKGLKSLKVWLTDHIRSKPKMGWWEYDGCD
jgi:hypothetical protein